MRRLLPLLAISVLLSACGGSNLTGSVTPGVDGQPASVELHEDDTVSLPGFSVDGHVLSRDGEMVAVFEYGSEDDSQADRDKVSGDGQSIDGNAITWTDSVHFFHHGRVIVVYVGNNEDMLGKLRT